MGSGFAVYKMDKDVIWVANSWLWDQVFVAGSMASVGMANRRILGVVLAVPRAFAHAARPYRRWTLRIRRVRDGPQICHYRLDLGHRYVL